MARLGLDYDWVCQFNEKIIYASISGFGQAGPFKDLPALDLVIQAMSGLMSLTGQREGPADSCRRIGGGCKRRHLRRLGYYGRPFRPRTY